MPFSKCHNRYAHEVLSKSQSQRRRLREMASMRRSLRALRPPRQRRKKKLRRKRRLELKLSAFNRTAKGFSTHILHPKSTRKVKSYCTYNATTQLGGVRSAPLPNDFFSKNFSKKTPLALDYTRPYVYAPPLLFSLGYTSPRPPNTTKNALKTFKGAGEAEIGLVGPLRSLFWNNEQIESSWLVISSAWFDFGRAALPCIMQFLRIFLEILKTAP
jgi:hypothetical protein